MKFTLLVVSFAWLFIGQAQQTYTDSIQQLRDEHQVNFKKEVLNATEAKEFRGICYFPVDSNYKVKAEFKRVKGKKFAMPMSKARLVYYKQYGTLTFKIHDTVCVLAVYQNLDLKGDKTYKNYLFLPFKDGTTAISSYGAGRYLDIERVKGTTWEIDFNMAYHPYCAYSERYSCPIVPTENTISPEVKAGECFVAHD